MPVLHKKVGWVFKPAGYATEYEQSISLPARREKTSLLFEAYSISVVKRGSTERAICPSYIFAGFTVFSLP